MGAIKWLIGLAGGAGGGWIIYAVVAAVAAAGGGVAGYKAKSLLDAPVIARAQTAQASAEKATEAAERRMSDYHAQVEKDRADANALASQQQQALSSQLQTARAQLASQTVARQRASQALLEALKNVPQVDTSPIGPGARMYYDSVRQQQHAAAGAATGNQNPSGLPRAAN